MGANKFVSMVHRNTNKLTLILVYALLEWVLIVFLLLNSLFSYLILKFADFFGLSRPCLFCSRIDHVFDPSKSYRDLVCDHHASEIGQLGYCSNHRKLVETHHLCEDCSSKVSENGEVGSVSAKCCCCGVTVDDSRLFSHRVLVKPSFGVFDYTHEGGLIAEAGVDEGVDQSDRSISEFVADDEAEQQQEQGIGEDRGIQVGFEVDESDSAVSEKEAVGEIGSGSNKVDVVVEKETDLIKLNDDDDDDGNLNISIDNLCSSHTTAATRFDSIMDASPEIMSPHMEFCIGHDDYRLIPVKLIHSATEENQIQHTCEEAYEDVTLDLDVQVEREAEQIVDESSTKEEEEYLLPPIHESENEPQLAGVESCELDQLVENTTSLLPEEEVVLEVDLKKEENELIVTAQATEFPLADGDDVQETVREMDAVLIILVFEEEDAEMQDDEIEADVSIGTEIPDHEQLDEYQAHEGPSTSHGAILATEDDQSFEKVEEVEFKTISVETSAHPLFRQLSRSLELNDFEEDKVPDTPSSVDSLHQLNRKLFSLERRESGTESLDGSVISDIEAGELSIEKLSSALRAERKALNSLYAELEEERSSSAVSANQTMAMINRLHEEKAAMQMEALQYQRMMEEQSEYDQEALQLLNELMVKREREKQELEKELEAYRKKVLEYEAREKMLMLRRKEVGIRSMTSSVSCSNAEDSDGSVDLNREVKEDDGHFSHQDCGNDRNTPTDAVLYLEESLANFEEERMSILEELRVLEEKLFSMNSEEEEQFEDVKTFENGPVNGNGYNVNGEANGHHKEMNERHHHGTRMVSKPKRLLPLFSAIELEAEDGVLNGTEHGFDSASQPDSSDSRYELENKRPAMEEEVDHVYERLQALEADREFLKHCVSSLKKGDKGVYLLQEILQHLRNLRGVELRARNMEDGVL